MARAQTEKLRYLAANIRRWRLRRGWTQESLAERAGIDARYIRTLESRHANPRTNVLLAVAEALGAPVGPLFRPAKLAKRKRGRPPGRSKPPPRS